MTAPEENDHPDPRIASAASHMEAYRRAVDALVGRCLDRVRRTPVPFDAEPLEAWSPDE
jgi:hypothetical protein